VYHLKPFLLASMTLTTVSFISPVMQLIPPTAAFTVKLRKTRIGSAGVTSFNSQIVYNGTPLQKKPQSNSYKASFGFVLFSFMILY